MLKRFPEPTPEGLRWGGTSATRVEPAGRLGTLVVVLLTVMALASLFVAYAMFDHARTARSSWSPGIGSVAVRCA